MLINRTADTADEVQVLPIRLIRNPRFSGQNRQGDGGKQKTEQ
jgi:hypothetical protein